MRLNGFHIIWHSDLGVYLGKLPPRPQFADLPFAANVWSFTPNLLQSAPAFRNRDEAEAETEGLFDGWKLRAVDTDLLVDGQAFASMHACIAAGIPPWLPGLEVSVRGYYRTEQVEPLVNSLRRLEKSGNGQSEIAWRRTSAGVIWSVGPYSNDGAMTPAIARGRGPVSGWI